MSANEYGRTIQYEPDGPVIPRPSEAEIHEANSLVNPRYCDCVNCLTDRLDDEAEAVMFGFQGK